MDTCIDFGDPAEMMRLAFATLASHERVWRERIDGWTDHTMTVEGWHERPYEGDIERAARLRRFAERRLDWLRDVNLAERIDGPAVIDATAEPWWFDGARASLVSGAWKFRGGISSRPGRRKDAIEVPHGTTYGYQLGCRCPECKKAHMESHRRSDSKKLAEMMADPDDPRHGKRSGYVIGCRCPRCKKAQSDYGRAWRRRKAEAR